MDVHGGIFVMSQRKWFTLSTVTAEKLGAYWDIFKKTEASSVRGFVKKYHLNPCKGKARPQD